MREKHQIVILPTNDISTLFFNGSVGMLFYRQTQPAIKNDIVIPQHLYVLSNEEIKEGDWYILQIDSRIQKKSFLHQHTARTHDKLSALSSSAKKVIATTDPKLWIKIIPATRRVIASDIAEISTDFIQAFIKAYNEGKQIKEIMIEYKMEHYALTSKQGAWRKVLNLRPDSTIIIHPVKERMFTEEEMLNFGAACVYEMLGLKLSQANIAASLSKEMFEKYLSENQQH